MREWTARSWVALGIGALAWALHWAYLWPQLPESVAVHFDAAGRADRWLTRSGFALLQGLAVGALVLVPGLGCALLRKAPPAWLCLPNRDHWLETGRRALAVQRLGSLLRELVAGALLWLIWLNQAVLQAQRSGELGGPLLWGAVAAAVAGIALWSAGVRRAFRVPERPGGAPPPARAKS